MDLVLLHTNDLHGKLTLEMAERIAKRVADEGALYLDSGDCVKAGNLAVPLSRDPAWELLARAGCRAGCPGNRESHVVELGLKAKMAGRAHPLVCSNWFRRSQEPVFPPSLVLEQAGLTIGLVGGMVPIVTERMASRAASAFLWTQPIPALVKESERLRPEVDLLIALTHIGHRQDLELAQSTPAIDIILGGHSHTVVHEPVRIGSTSIVQGGSHARYIGRYQWSGGRLEGGLIPMETV